MNRFLKVVLLLTIAAVLGGPAPSSAWPIPDTGQTQCYVREWNGTDWTWSEGACPQPGEPLYGQDGNYMINAPSYSKLDENGNDLADDATDWVMVRDNVTGLIWEVKRNTDGLKNYSDPHDADNTYTWYDPDPTTNGGDAGTHTVGMDTKAFIDALNAARFDGFDDWRLPTVKELRSIVDQSRINPAINTSYFGDTVSSDYWSSTTLANLTNGAWGVDFGHGDDSWGYKYYYDCVRAVRGGQSGSFGNLIINGDGTVTDAGAGLMWQQNAGTAREWVEAISDCEGATLADYDDWRLPTIKELGSIVDQSRSDPAINTSYFPDTVSSSYWSSTTLAGNAGFPWAVSFGNGSDFWDTESEDRYVRAVRGGQARLLGHLCISLPNQGSNWKIGDAMSISWETHGISGNVKIVISRQGGKADTFEPIEETTVNDGIYEWTVTGPLSANCVLKIEPLSDPAKGTSQGLFSVYGLPSAITGSASAIGGDAATLNGTVNPGFLQAAVVFEWGEAETYGNEITATQSPLTGGVAQNVSGTLDGLTPARTYHYRVKATNSAGTSYGEDEVFTTEAVLPSVTTIPVTSIGPNTAQGGGEVTADGGAEVTARGICWSTSPNPTIASDKTMDGTGIGSFTSSMTGLAPGTTYHVRAYATNSAGTGYGENVPFSTSTEPLALVEIQSGSGARGQTFTLPVILTNVSGAEVAAVTVDVGYNPFVFENPKASVGPAGDAAGKTIATNEITPGLFRITIFSAANNNAIDDGVIAYLTLAILSSAPTNSSVLGCTPSGSDPLGEPVAIEGQGGTVTILGNMAGDCNGDGNVSIAELQLSIAELQSAINMYLEILPVLDCVDVNGNGKVSVGEVQKVINNHLNLSAASRVASLERGSPDRFNVSVSNGIPSLDLGAATGSLGATITVPLTLTNASGYLVSAVSTDITYDTRYLESPSVAIGPAGTDAGKDVIFNEISSGTIRVGVFSAGNNNLIANGIVAYVSFTIKTSASTGQTILGNSPSGSDPSGNDIAMDGSDGSVTVTFSSNHYVCSDGICGNNTPCHRTVREAVEAAGTGTLIKIAAEEHDGNFSLNADKSLTLQGGWDKTFNNPNGGTTTLHGAPKAPQGSLTFQNLKIVP